MFLLEIDWNGFLETGKVNIVSVSMSDIESVSFGRSLALIWLRSSIITKEDG